MNISASTKAYSVANIMQHVLQAVTIVVKQKVLLFTINLTVR
jgi:hypothetical protein